MPTAAISAARTMKSRKTPESSTLSLVRCSTSSQTTASAGAPGACARPRRRPSRSRCRSARARSSRARAGRAPSGRRGSTLASSRATSPRITSPSGRARRAVEPDHVDDRGGAGQDLHDPLGALGRRDDPQVDHAAGRLPRYAPRARSLAAVRARIPRCGAKSRARSATRTSLARCGFRPTPYLVCRTHVPPDDHRPPDKRSLRELVRAAVDTAAEFATLGEAHRLRSASSRRRLASPPPRARTRTAGHSVVTSAARRPSPVRATRTGLRLAGSPSAGTRAPDHAARRRPVWEDGRAGRAAPSSNALGPPLRRLERLGAVATASTDGDSAHSWRITGAHARGRALDRLRRSPTQDEPPNGRLVE